MIYLVDPAKKTRGPWCVPFCETLCPTFCRFYL